jgi:hypothetical protein
MATVTADVLLGAVIADRRLSADALIVGGRTGHSRQLDHLGTEMDTVVVLDGPIEKYPAGTTVHLLLIDVIERITALESGNHVVSNFTIGAMIEPYLTAAAIIQGSWSQDATIDAEISGPHWSVTIDAMLSIPTEGSIRASAYLIDHVI